MIRDNLNDLVAFVAIAREGSFTRAAASLGVSQSALSHTITGLEKRLGIRLLSRSTRSVSPTEAGERLLATVAPRIDEIESELSLITDMTGRPSGVIRITTSEHAAVNYVWPRLVDVLRQYPEITLEMTFDSRLVDMVAERYDIGIRFGESIPKDMIAVKISDDCEMAAVASASYFERYPIPTSPDDLKDQNCINLRLPTYGGLYSWEFGEGDTARNSKVTGQLIFDSAAQAHRASLDGLGMAFLPYDMVQHDIEQGRLIRVLESWCPSFPGFHAYFPNRRERSSAFNIIIDALRHKKSDVLQS